MSIRKKILLILLVFAVIPMVFVGILGFANARKALESARMEALKSVADFKAKMIEDFFAEQKKHILIAQQRPTIKKYTSILAGFSDDFSSPAYETIRKELDRTLRMYQPAYNYINVVLVNPEGRIVYALNKSSAPEKLANSLPNPWGKPFHEFKNEIHFSNIYAIGCPRHSCWEGYYHNAFGKEAEMESKRAETKRDIIEKEDKRIKTQQYFLPYPSVSLLNHVSQS